jgi:2-oxoglutarate ferredoxin oxidoreductase subunit alpha
VALDQAVAQNSATVALFDIAAVEVKAGGQIGAAQIDQLNEVRRYLINDSGISSWAPPGTAGGMSLVTGNEHDEWGHVSTEPGNRVRMMDKRARKVDQVLGDLPGALLGGDPDAAIGMLGVGLESGPLLEAAERLSDHGNPVSVLIPRTLWPVPKETLDFINAHDLTYVVEHNSSGQLASVLRSVGAPADRIASLLRYDGLPFTAGDLVERFLAAEAGQ